MPKLNLLSARQFIKILEKQGYSLLRQKGSHKIFTNEKGNLVTGPVHAGKKLDRSLMLKIIKKEMRLTREEFEKLL